MLTRLKLSTVVVALSAVNLGIVMRREREPAWSSPVFPYLGWIMLGWALTWAAVELNMLQRLLDTESLIVHLYDGRRMRARVVAVEPELDAALLKIVPPALDTTLPSLSLRVITAPSAVICACVPGGVLCSRASV